MSAKTTHFNSLAEFDEFIPFDLNQKINWNMLFVKRMYVRRTYVILYVIDTDNGKVNNFYDYPGRTLSLGAKGNPMIIQLTLFFRK